MIGTLLGLAAVVALIVANALFVAVEFSLVAVDRATVELEAADGDRRAVLVANMVGRLSFYLSGVQLGITVTSVVLGVLAEPTVAHALRGPIAAVIGPGHATGVSVVLALALATVVQMVVGELVPKSVAVARPLRVARTLAPFARGYGLVFAPVVRAFGGAADAAVRAMGIEPKEELSTVRSRQELVRLVKTSGAEGTLEAGEVQLLTKAFRFAEKTVADALTPRTDIVALPVGATGAELIARSVATGFSRFPVFDADLDDIVGVVHVKSVFDVPYEQRASIPVVELMGDAFVVPESRDLDELLVEMRDEAAYLAVVLDEYGGTAGIITLEDLLEEIVGEIADEHDVAPVATAVADGGSVVVPGGLHPDEVAEATGFEVPEGEYETVAGFVLDRLGRIPDVGDRVELDGWVIEVLAMDRRRISSLRVQPPADAGPTDRDPDPDAAPGERS